MSAERFERTVKASVLDRLIDDQPLASADPPPTRSESERAFRTAVLRDLEWLLNTRSTTVQIPDGLDEVTASVFNYGLSDLSSMPAEGPETHQQLLRHIEASIRTFEPRLVDVHVSVAEAETTERHVRFKIEGLLDMDPNPERIVFDSVVELSSGEVLVSDGRA